MNTINTNLHNKIAKAFFLDFTNTTTVSKKIYPSLKSKNAGAVSSSLSLWKKKGYIEEGRIVRDKINKKTRKKYTQALTAYKLNMVPYFDYAKEKLNISPEEKLSRVEWLTKLEKNRKDGEKKKVREELLKGLEEKEFNEIEKEILNYIFSFKELRKIACKDSNLFSGITRVLERIFFYNSPFLDNYPLASYFRKGFFIKNKKYIRLTTENYLDKLSEIKNFERTSNEYFINLMKKIQIITDFSDENYFRFMAKSTLRKYQYMPSFQGISKEKDKTKKIKSIHDWSKLYFFDEIPEGDS